MCFSSAGHVYDMIPYLPVHLCKVTRRCCILTEGYILVRFCLCLSVSPDAHHMSSLRHFCMYTCPRAAGGICLSKPYNGNLVLLKLITQSTRSHCLQDRNQIALPLQTGPRKAYRTAHLHILKRFEFEAPLLRSGVLVVDDDGEVDTALVFIRGAPVVVEQLIKNSSTPADYRQVNMCKASTTEQSSSRALEIC